MKTLEILEQVEKTGRISEKNINILNLRLNAGEKMELSYIWNNHAELEPSQVEKAKKWLLNQWKTPSGKERKNSPFGYREEEALETCKTMFLVGFYDCARYGQKSWFVPIYYVSGENCGFEYYLAGGKIEIIG